VIADEWRVLLRPVQSLTKSAREAQLQAIRCRSGWVVEERRLTRFDAFAGVAEDGRPIAAGILGKKCTS
jgi:hypothetical protein